MFKNYTSIGKNILLYNTRYLKYEKLNNYIIKLNNKNKNNKIIEKINKSKGTK